MKSRYSRLPIPRVSRSCDPENDEVRGGWFGRFVLWFRRQRALFALQRPKRHVFFP